MTPELEAQIQALPIMVGLSADQQRELRRWLRPIHVAAGEVIFRQGERGAALLLIVDGIIRIDVAEPNGDPQSVGNIKSGDMLGEIAFLEPGPRSATATAASDVVLLEFTNTDFELVQRRSPAIATRVLAWMTSTTARRLRNVNRDLERTIAAYAEPLAAGAQEVRASTSALARFWARISGAVQAD